MINPYYLTNRAVLVGLKINLDSHRINHANSKLTFKPNFPEFAIETRSVKKVLQETFTIYATLLNQ